MPNNSPFFMILLDPNPRDHFTELDNRLRPLLRNVHFVLISEVVAVVPHDRFCLQSRTSIPSLIRC